MKQSKKTKQLAIWFLLTLLAFTLAIVWDRSTRNEVSATSSPAVAEKTNPSVHGTKIQNIQLGERVVGKNPQENDGLDESILTEIPHVGYNLLFKKPDGTHSSIELLRPKNWLETEKIILREVSETTASDEVLKNAIRQKSSDGKDCNIEVYIDLPELGTVGWATLISIKENIEIKGGSGNVVTGRFRHVANNVIDLQVEGVEKIGCTDNHPIWSVDREDFIEAGKLVEGERVLLYNGETRRVVQKLPRPGPQYVNNLEVFGEHVYHVTLDGLLVHNQYTKYFRTMSEEHYEILINNHRLTATGETFISPESSFSDSYDGIKVEFTINNKILDQLRAIGRCNVPMVDGGRTITLRAKKGWGSQYAYFKKEDYAHNIGLGKGTALEIFNNGLINGDITFRKVKKE